MSTSRITPILIVLVFLAGGLMAAENRDAVMKDGKKGEIHVTEAVAVGDIQLSPGTYIVQHRVEADEHLMYFTAKDQGGEEQSVPVRCERDPKSPRWLSSSYWIKLKDGGKAIEKIMIQGEKITYNFE